MKLLLTAFDPFGGEKINPAYEAVKLLPDEIGGAKIVKKEIPTVFQKGPDAVYEAIQENQKGSCENDHSNFRRIVPKGTNMDPYTQELIDLIFSHVNSFSRTSLNGHTPYESFRFLYGQDILDLWHIRYIKPNDVILKPFLVNQFLKNEGVCHDDVH